MLGSFTIVHKPAAQQPRGRGRRAAGAPPEGSENANPNSAAIVITTKGGWHKCLEGVFLCCSRLPAYQPRQLDPTDSLLWRPHDLHT
jgi:hypothetical protein